MLFRSGGPRPRRKASGPRGGARPPRDPTAEGCASVDILTTCKGKSTPPMHGSGPTGRIAPPRDRGGDGHAPPAPGSAAEAAGGGLCCGGALASYLGSDRLGPCGGPDGPRLANAGWSTRGSSPPRTPAKSGGYSIDASCAATRWPWSPWRVTGPTGRVAPPRDQGADCFTLLAPSDAGTTVWLVIRCGENSEIGRAHV